MNIYQLTTEYKQLESDLIESFVNQTSFGIIYVNYFKMGFQVFLLAINACVGVAFVSTLAS